MSCESGATDVNTVFQSFYDRIAEIINKHAPIRNLSRKETKSPSKPWVTPGIKTSIRNKEKFYKRLIETEKIVKIIMHLKSLDNCITTQLDILTSLNKSQGNNF